MYSLKLRKYVEDGMKDAIKQYNDTKYKKAIDKVQKEVKLYIYTCTREDGATYEVQGLSLQFYNIVLKNTSKQ